MVRLFFGIKNNIPEYSGNVIIVVTERNNSNRKVDNYEHSSMLFACVWNSKASS